MRRHPGENKCIVVAVLFLPTSRIACRATRNDVVFLAFVILILLFLAIFILLVVGVYLER